MNHPARRREQMVRRRMRRLTVVLAFALAPLLVLLTHVVDHGGHLQGALQEPDHADHHHDRIGLSDAADHEHQLQRLGEQVPTGLLGSARQVADVSELTPDDHIPDGPRHPPKLG